MKQSRGARPLGPPGPRLIARTRPGNSLAVRWIPSKKRDTNGDNTFHGCYVGRCCHVTYKIVGLDDSTAHPAGAGGARPGMPLSGMRVPFHGGAPCEALGRRGRDEPQEYGAAVPAAPPHGSRGAGQGGHEPRRDGAVLHAQRESAGRCTEEAGMAGCTQRASSGGCSECASAGGHTRTRGAGGFQLTPSPAGHSRHPVQRGRALPRLNYPVGDRSRCPGCRGGVSGRRPVEVWKPEISPANTVNRNGRCDESGLVSRRLASVSSSPG